MLAERRPEPGGGLEYRLAALLAVWLALACMGYAAIVPAANSVLKIHLPAVHRITAGEGVSWMVRSSAGDGSQPAVFLLSGPAGVSFKRIAEDKHQLNWSTGTSDVGSHVFTFLVEDASDRSISVRQTLSVDVVPQTAIRQVRLNALENVRVSVGEQIQFQVVAVNSLGHDTLFHTKELPGGARFVQQDDGSRLFTWMPAQADQGRHTLTFVATDEIERHQSDTATVEIQVDAVPRGSDSQRSSGEASFASDESAEGLSREAAIEPLPERIVVAGQAMSQLVRASIPDEKYELIATDMPDGASFVTAAGRERVFRWRPQVDQLGLHQVRFAIRERQTKEISVRGDLHLSVRLDRVRGENKPPVLHVSGEESVIIGEELMLEVAAVDPDGYPPLLMVGSAPADARFVDTGNGQRRFSWAPGQEDQGVHVLEFIARDRQAPEKEVIQRVRIVVMPASTIQ